MNDPYTFAATENHRTVRALPNIYNGTAEYPILIADDEGDSMTVESGLLAQSLAYHSAPQHQPSQPNPQQTSSAPPHPIHLQHTEQWRVTDQAMAAHRQYAGQEAARRHAETARLPRRTYDEFLCLYNGHEAGPRARRRHRSSSECAACSTSATEVRLHRMRCTHEYCMDCIETMFRLSLEPDAVFPPRCCNQHLRSSAISNTALHFEYHEKQRSEQEKLFQRHCHNPRCHTPIKASYHDNSVGECSKCQSKTCMICCEAAHVDTICPDERALRTLNLQAGGGKWMRCPRCYRAVTKSSGCDHMVCACKAEFCYQCGALYTRCRCHRAENAARYLYDHIGRDTGAGLQATQADVSNLINTRTHDLYRGHQPPLRDRYVPGAQRPANSHGTSASATSTAVPGPAVPSAIRPQTAMDMNSSHHSQSAQPAQRGAQFYQQAIQIGNYPHMTTTTDASSATTPPLSFPTMDTQQWYTNSLLQSEYLYANSGLGTVQRQDSELNSASSLSRQQTLNRYASQLTSGHWSDGADRTHRLPQNNNGQSSVSAQGHVDIQDLRSPMTITPASRPFHRAGVSFQPRVELAQPRRAGSIPAEATSSVQPLSVNSSMFLFSSGQASQVRASPQSERLTDPTRPQLSATAVRRWSFFHPAIAR